MKPNNNQTYTEIINVRINWVQQSAHIMSDVEDWLGQLSSFFGKLPICLSSAYDEKGGDFEVFLQ